MNYSVFFLIAIAAFMVIWYDWSLNSDLWVEYHNFRLGRKYQKLFISSRGFSPICISKSMSATSKFSTPINQQSFFWWREDISDGNWSNPSVQKVYLARWNPWVAAAIKFPFNDFAQRRRLYQIVNFAL